MFPTFLPKDLLRISVYRSFSEVRPGDAVIYGAPGGKKTVHRIVRIENGKIRTRGDNNNLTDSYALVFSDLIGRVDRIERGGKCRYAYAGVRGFVWHILMQIRTRIWRGSVYLFGGAFRRISDVFSFLPAVPPDAKSVIYEKHGRRELQIHSKRRIIAKKNLETGKCSVRFPYRLCYGRYLKQHGFDLK